MQLPVLVGRYFEANVGRRLYIQVDKPLYKPGETIWFKAWDLTASSLSGTLAAPGGGAAAEPKAALVELVSPKGAVVMKKRVRAAAGGAVGAVGAVAAAGSAGFGASPSSPSGGTANDFELPAEAQGGEYTLRVTTLDGQHKAERAIIVSAYEAPRLKKKLEFVKKAYGAGDVVTATVEVKRPTGEPLANKALAAVVTVDGVELPRVKFTSNAEGSALVKFELPKTIAAGDGLLTILVEDGGVTESVSKAIPILQKKLVLGFFPEGGRMVAGLPTRLYFEAKTPLGKPADVEGRIVDDLGNTVATFGSHKNGLGRFDFTPATGRSYRAEVMRPAGIDERYALPLAEAGGCVLRSYDDFDGQLTALRVGVRCSEKQTVVVSAMQRERLLDVAMVEAGPGAPAVVHLGESGSSSAAQMQRAAGVVDMTRAAGVARITLFNQHLDPLAERLVFRNRRARLQVTAVLDKKRHYSPRDEVEMTITTRDAVTGRAVPAELALSVVDDTVVSFADDKSGHLLSKLLLEPELPGKVEEPNFYLDLTEAKSALALDLLMGTRGYRRFDWVQVLRPPLDLAMAARAAGRGGQAAIAALDAPRELRVMPAPVPMAMPRAGMAAPPPPPAPPAPPAPPPPMVARQEMAAAAPAVVRDNMKERADIGPRGALMAGAPVKPGAERDDARLGADADFARAAQRQRRAANAVVAEEQMAWAPVRVFPIPAFQPAGHTGPRDDFRETVLWVPALKTNGRGKAQVKFTLSDAVTSFRVFAEGVSVAGGGLPGRSETVFKSTLPFSLAAKLPLEISAGDRPLIPITLSNDSERALDVKLDARFGALLK
ncbi:MAG: alpha-2-macroglobulin family protein, partial [Rubrivivax sp.]